METTRTRTAERNIEACTKEELLSSQHQFAKGTGDYATKHLTRKSSDQEIGKH